MTVKQGQLSLALLYCMDLGLMLVALGASIVVLYSPNAETGVADYSRDFFVSRVKLSNAILCAALMLIWHLCFKAYGLYHSYRLKKLGDIIVDVSKAVGAVSIALLISAQLAGWKTITVVTVLVFCLLSNALVSTFRLAVYRLSQLFRRRGINTKSLLVIGGGPRAQQLMTRIGERSEVGYKIIGFLDSSMAFRNSSANGVPWLGEFDKLAGIIDNSVVDEVAIALPIKSQYSQIKESIDCLEEQGIVVHLLSDLFPQRRGSVRPAEFRGLPLLSLSNTPPFYWRSEVKRLLDVVLSIALLVIGAPIFVLTAIAIKLDSPGSVFFIQERMGYNKRRFSMVKFRTMVRHAESLMDSLDHLNEKDGPIFKIANDPRLTSIGKLLRKLSIDELPQLLNVLAGDMSLVGPRPLSIRDALNLQESWQKRRFSVRPGMTCLWQISGRSNLTFDEWVELDLQYIDTWSLQLDWWILIKTLPAVIAARGAV